MRTFLVFLLGVLTLSGQAQTNGSRLEDVLKSAGSPEERAEILYDSARALSSQDPALSNRYARRLVNESPSPSWKAKGHWLQARNHKKLDNKDKMVVHYDKSIAIYGQIGDADGEYSMLRRKGSDLKRIDHEAGAATFNQMLERARADSRPVDEGDALTGLADIQRYKGNYARATELYLEAADVLEHAHAYDELVGTLNNLAVNYTLLENYEKALEIQLKNLEVVEKTGDSVTMILIGNNVGIEYLDKGDTAKAEKLFKRSAHIIELLGEENVVYKYVAGTYQNLGTLASGRGDLETALKYQLASLRILEENNSPKDISMDCAAIAEIYLEMLLPVKARPYIQRSLEIAEAIDYTHGRMDAHGLFARYYSATDQYKEAFASQQEYIFLRDSLLSAESANAVAEMQTKYESAKKDEENQVLRLGKAKEESLRKQAQAEAEAKDLQLYLAVGGVVVCLLFALGAVWTMRQRKKTNTALMTQKRVIEHKNNEVMNSIEYAKKLQDAIMPSTVTASTLLRDCFILYKPKDIVAGDFYWMERKGEEIWFAAADCTGHGVPGALVSVVCSNALNRAVNEFELQDPGKVLDKTRDLVLETFKRSQSVVKDGMDIALCRLNMRTLKLAYAGANNPLWLVRKEEEQLTSQEERDDVMVQSQTTVKKHYRLIEIKADKQPIGLHFNQKPFNSHEMDLREGDSVYLFSDGYADQFGGPDGKKFKYGPLKQLILKHQDLAMKDQEAVLERTLNEWKGELEQVDDICVIGTRVMCFPDEMLEHSTSNDKKTLSLTA